MSGGGGAASGEPPFAGRLMEEGAAIVAGAEQRGAAARLLGGVAIRLLLGDRLDASYERPCRDIDVICGRRDGRVLEQLLAARGWAPAVAFNALNGARRLLFHDPLSEAQVDVFVGAFAMCHELPLTDALDRPGPSLPATELLMTKLQIVELEDKDRGDLFALLVGCDVGGGDDGGGDGGGARDDGGVRAAVADGGGAHAGERVIEPARLARLTGRDWGLHHTFERNLALLREQVERGEGPPAARAAIEAIAAAMDAEPKSRGWRLRAKVGERKRWYELPEEVERG